MSLGDYDALYEQSREGGPFSNSDEGMAFMDAWCNRCVHDRPARQGNDAKGCPLVLLTLTDRTPAQFVDGRCTEFRDEDSGPGPEPQPVPDPPGQLLLLPRAPFEGVRMLSPLPEPDPLPAVLAAHRVTDGTP
ncbi:hypothetical protein [Streptomyces sp. SBT349]|uniref:hypothetical protein n=1 Tax=Streptomyces sp. SBT349 TaxID=1580539 RepID=UPI00066D8A9A|nr:hypothetical protein [Streptomyces sp. SBT349]